MVGTVGHALHGGAVWFVLLCHVLLKQVMMLGYVFVVSKILLISSCWIRIPYRIASTFFLTIRLLLQVLYSCR